MDNTLFFNTLFSFCKEQSDPDLESDSGIEKKTSQSSLDINTVWTTIFNIASKDPIYLPFFLPLIKQYSLSIPDFQNFNSPDIEKSIQVASNDSLDFNERLTSITPVVYLISILSLENSLKTFKCLIDLIFIQISQNQELPENIMKILELTNCSSLADEILESFLDSVESFVNTDKFKAAMLLFSYFAPAAIETLPDPCSKIGQWLIDCLKQNSSKEEKAVALLLIRKSAVSLYQNPTSIPINKIFVLILPLLVDKDSKIQRYANKTVKQLISSQNCYTKEAAALIISQFPKYTEDQRPLFFSLISRFLDNEETPQLAIVQKIYDFSMTLIKSQDPFLVAHSIEILSEISSLSFEYIREALDTAFDAAIGLTSHSKCFSEISNFFLAVSQNAPKYKSAQIDEKLPLLVDSLTDEESGTRKKRLERAESLATIIIGNKEKINNELLSKIIKFSIDSIEGGDNIYVCALVLALSKQLNEESANIIFKKLEAIGREETDSIKLNSILHTMKKLMKLYSIDAIDFITDILKGNIKYFGGLPVYTVQDTKTMIFLFITIYVRKFPQKSADICSKLIDYVPNVSYVLLPSILEPIEAGITAGIVSNEKAQQLSSSVLETLDKLLLEDEMEVIACIEILRKINIHHPVLDNEKTLAVLKQLLESSQENEENNSLDGPIIHFVFELVLNESKKNQDAKFDNEFLINIMKKLPLPPQTRYSTEIMTLLTNDFMSNTEKFGFLSFQCLLSIVELLISQNISQYELPTDLVNKMKSILKQKLKEDKTLERQISKSFQNARPKQNRFSKLLKTL